MNATRYIAISCLYLAAASPLPAADLYQWIDSRGGTHYTDNLNSVPVALRNSGRFIVRRNFLSASEPAASALPPAPPMAADVKPEPPGDTPAPASAPQHPVIDYTTQQTTIIVVNSNPRQPMRKPCGGSGHCRPAFRPDFNDRRYIHPSVFNGGSRQYIQP